MTFKTIILILIAILLIAGTYKFSLSDYEEECFQYLTIWKNFTYQDYSSYSDCLDISIYSKCRIINKSFSIPVINKDICVKYHLVRKV